MIPSNPIPAVCNYGASAVYKEEPSEEQIRAGVVPLDSLPAGWWNCMWYANNRAINCARAAADSLIQEMNTVLTQAGVCPQEACYDQLYQAIEKIRTTIGTTLVAGAVKSSTTTGNVAIAADGTMSVNCLGTPSSLNTSSKQVVGAINELKTTYDCCVSTLNTSITNVNNAKAPNNHASSETTYGVGNASNYGHLKISDQYTSVLTACTGVAASQKAVADAYSALNTAIGNKAPKSHASCETTYGVGTSSVYGHLKIDDTYDSTLSACSGVAASQKGLSDAYSTLNTAIGNKAPKSHASSATTYGVGTSSNYGHLKISDTYTSVLSACSGVAASQKAVADAYSALANAGYASLGDTAGCSLAATGSAGTATTAARSDHVHPYPTCACCSRYIATADTCCFVKCCTSGTFTPASGVYLVMIPGQTPQMYICNNLAYDITVCAGSCTAFWCNCYSALLCTSASCASVYTNYRGGGQDYPYSPANVFKGSIIPAGGKLAIYGRTPACLLCFYCCAVYYNNMTYKNIGHLFG